MKYNDDRGKRTFRRLLMMMAIAAGLRGQGDVPYSELSVPAAFHSRYAFGFDAHKAKLRSIKNRRRTGRR